MPTVVEQNSARQQSIAIIVRIHHRIIITICEHIITLDAAVRADDSVGIK